MSRVASSKRASAKAAGGAPEDDEEVRSYNSMQYWDQRYQHHLAQQATNGGNQDTAEEAAAAGAAGPAAKASKKRGRSAGASSSGPAASAVGAGSLVGDGASSDDITAEWYYSFGDLAHLLLPAFRGLDRSGSVLDIGCGVSNFFDDLRKPVRKNSKKAGKTSDATGSDADVGGGGFTGAFIGLDYSPTVIAHLRQQTPETAENNLHWVCGDACHLLPELEGEHDDEEEEKPKSKKAKKAKQSAASSAAAGSAASAAPPALTSAEQALFRPESFALILDKATSDGMLCSDHTARLTPLIYANVARLLAPNGLFVIASVNEPDSGWFGEYVVSQLLSHGGDSCQWQIEVHTPSNYKDGEDGAPNVYIIKKAIAGGGRAVRDGTREQREPYTIKQMSY